MEDIPVYRIRRWARMRRAKEAAEEKKHRLELHIKRAAADLRVVNQFGDMGQIIGGQVILNDLRRNGVKVFSQVPLQEGTELKILVKHPRNFYIRACVRHCANVTHETRIIHQVNYGWRLWLEFVFETFDEKALVYAYCDQIASELVNETIAA